VEKFELLYSVLLSLDKAGVLSDCVLVGSWCQDFYRHLYNNPFQIPAATTTDADLLVPKNLKFKQKVNVAVIMEENGFKVEQERTSSLMKFIHEDFKFEFLTNAGAKPEEKVYSFKNLNINVQELHFMNIPLTYNLIIPFRDISLRIPEPEAFALHKLIICQRRRNPLKKEKDTATARGMFEFIATQEKRIKRLHEILNGFPRGWKKKVDEALKNTGLELPVPRQ
jgi:hypothetical protein